MVLMMYSEAATGRWKEKTSKFNITSNMAMIVMWECNTSSNHVTSYICFRVEINLLLSSTRV